MASSLPTHSSSSGSNRPAKSTRIAAQTALDAKIHADFEESSSTFDYSSSVRLPARSADANQPDRMTSTYLHQIQKGRLIQPFGCLLAIHEKTLRITAYSENAPEMLTIVGHAVPSVGDSHPVLGIGTDIRTIFTSPGASALQKACGFVDVSLLNPILVHCRTSGKPFYAIIHRVMGSLIFDFEPVKIYDVPMTAAGALQSYKLAAKAISQLQSLPSGSTETLCNTMVKEVFELTGYDRVMAYKFHEDDHGEVIAEITKPGLEPYVGLHYPATDIPQAARFLFMKNKVRMICDCRAKNVKVLQDENLPFDLTLCGSTLRAPHGCHARYMENMNSIASLILAIVVNEDDQEGNRSKDSKPSNSSAQQQRRKRLWGLVVCHNTTPRFVPFPLRYACEFLSQVFAIHMNKELELESQIIEKNILRTQTLLCDMLMRDAPPLGIVSQTPNIMDLVKCNGAALLFKGKIWKLGITPTDYQIQDISAWLSKQHTDSTGLTTDSLFDAGYPGALALGNTVCGMVAAKLTVDDMLFWFRSHTEADIRWAGAKHQADDDDLRMMHPRTSFKAFLGIMKNRSVPWKDHEVDAIHSLQLIVRKTFKDCEAMDLNTNIINAKINGQFPELEAVTSEMVRLIETANVPIFAVNVDGVVNGWNLKISELTGCSADFALGKRIVDLVEDSSVDTVKNMVDLAKQGQEEKNIQFEIRRRNDSSVDSHSHSHPISLVVNACASRDVEGKVIVGICFVGQDITGQKTVMDKFTKIQAEYRAIVHNPNPLIPPIFGTDEYGGCSEWNPAMENISGWKRDETIDKMLLGEVFGTRDTTCCCQLKSQESLVNLGIVLNNAMSGHDSDKVKFGFSTKGGEYVDCLLCVSRKVDREGRVTGIFCFLQLASHELQQAIYLQRLNEQTALKRGKALGYIKRQIRNPVSGIMFSGKILEGLGVGDEQMMKALQISASCQNQLKKVLDDDSDFDTIVDGYLELEMVEFKLHEVLGASLSQVMMKSNEKGIHIVHNREEGDDAATTAETTLYGDALRLQQILADFMLIAVNFTNPGGCVGVQVRLRKDRLGESAEIGHTELRISHGGRGIPEALLNHMFGGAAEGEPSSEEGMSLMVSRKLVKLMNGDIQYVRAAGNSSFIISLELPIAQKPRN